MKTAKFKFQTPFFSPEELKRLIEFMKGIDESYDEVVFSGFSPKVWNTGGDLSYMLDCYARNNIDDLEAYASLCCDAVMASVSIPTHTVADVSGICFGGGLEAALTCDDVVVHDGTLFSLPEYKYGTQPGMGWDQMSHRLVPEVEDLLCNGETVPFYHIRSVRSGRPLIDSKDLYDDCLGPWLLDMWKAMGTNKEAMEIGAFMQKKLLAEAG